MPNEDILLHVSSYHGNDGNDGLTRATALHTFREAFMRFVGMLEHGDIPRIAVETIESQWEYI